jgi:type IV secretion system protein TrbL
MVFTEFIQPIIIIVIIIAFTAIVNQWIIGSADKTFFELLIKQPKFVDKPNATLADYNLFALTSNNNGGAGTGTETGTGSKLLSTYNSLLYVSIFLMAMAVIIGMIIFLGEQFGIQKKGQALDIISNAFFYILLLSFFPLLWDTIATGVEWLDIYIMNPGNPTPDAAAAKAKDLFIKLGGIDTGGGGLAGIFDGLGKLVFGNPDKITQVFHDIMTSVFRAFMAAMIFLTMFIVGTMRIVMTATIIVGLPLILAIKLIPWIRKPADRLLDTLYGLVVATIISSIVVVAGTAYLDSMPKDTLEQNFQATIAAMGVILLAVLMPVMLSPMLGSIITSVTGMATTALAAGATAAGAGIAGAARGASAAIGGGGAAQAMAAGFGGGGGFGGFGASLAKGAMSGMGSAGKSMASSFGDFLGRDAMTSAAGSAASGQSSAGTGSSAATARRSKAMEEAIRQARTEATLASVGDAPFRTEGQALPAGYDEVRELPETGDRPVVFEGEKVKLSPKDISTTTLDTLAGEHGMSSGLDSYTSSDPLNNYRSARKDAMAAIFSAEPAPLTVAKKVSAAARGAMLGALGGTTQGLLKGNAMVASSHGFGEFKTAGRNVFDAFDLNHDGKVDGEDVKAAIQKMDELAAKARSSVKSWAAKAHAGIENMHSSLAGPSGSKEASDEKPYEKESVAGKTWG